MAIEPIGIGIEELERIVDQAMAAPLTPEQHRPLRAAIATLGEMARLLDIVGTTVQQLRQLVLGRSRTSEKTAKVLADAPLADAPLADAAPPPAEPKPKAKRKGHGRNKASEYTGARRVPVEHPALRAADPCPACCGGRMHKLDPQQLIRIAGHPPLQATNYELASLRCGLCGQMYTAEPPPEAGPNKYDFTAIAMVALLKYGHGVPFYRLERLQKFLGVPLPATVQWELMEECADVFKPLLNQLTLEAAMGRVLHNDDTGARILKFLRDAADKRTGLHTSAIVSRCGDHDVALFFTGRRHAGENLAGVLELRPADAPPPIQMCDALGHNTSKDWRVLLANCLPHGRRKFVDQAASFPGQCRFVLETLRGVFHNDHLARERGMGADERLEFHQRESGPLMDKLNGWCKQQFDQGSVEPNSGLGKAISYMLNHWEPLTLFLRVAGAPLDNNVCERALKKAILNRKNAYFYKTKNGARVGDFFMSLIHTAELCGANPFDYLTELQRNIKAVAAAPDKWMPWNYREALGRADSAPGRGG